MRPASLAGMRLRSVADQVGEELGRASAATRRFGRGRVGVFDGAGDPAAVEAELASMRAELTRTLVDTDAALAGERRDRAARAEQLRGQADGERVRGDAAVTLPAGALLVFYTDGLVETRSRGVEDGIDLLCAVTAVDPQATPDEVCDAILASMIGPDCDDDVALLVIRID